MGFSIHNNLGGCSLDYSKGTRILRPDEESVSCELHCSGRAPSSRSLASLATCWPFPQPECSGLPGHNGAPLAPTNCYLFTVTEIVVHALTTRLHARGGILLARFYGRVFAKEPLRGHTCSDVCLDS